MCWYIFVQALRGIRSRKTSMRRRWHSTNFSGLFSLSSSVYQDDLSSHSHFENVRIPCDILPQRDPRSLPTTLIPEASWRGWSGWTLWGRHRTTNRDDFLKEFHPVLFEAVLQLLSHETWWAFKVSLKPARSMLHVSALTLDHFTRPCSPFFLLSDLVSKYAILPSSLRCISGTYWLNACMSKFAQLPYSENSRDESFSYPVSKQQAVAIVKQWKTNLLD